MAPHAAGASMACANHEAVLELSFQQWSGVSHMLAPDSWCPAFIRFTSGHDVTASKLSRPVQVDVSLLPAA